MQIGDTRRRRLIDSVARGFRKESRPEVVGGLNASTTRSLPRLGEVELVLVDWGLFSTYRVEHRISVAELTSPEVSSQLLRHHAAVHGWVREAPGSSRRVGNDGYPTPDDRDHIIRNLGLDMDPTLTGRRGFDLTMTLWTALREEGLLVDTADGVHAVDSPMLAFARTGGSPTAPDDRAHAEALCGRWLFHLIRTHIRRSPDRGDAGEIVRRFLHELRCGAIAHLPVDVERTRRGAGAMLNDLFLLMRTADLIEEIPPHRCGPDFFRTGAPVLPETTWGFVLTPSARPVVDRTLRLLRVVTGNQSPTPRAVRQALYG